jgi:glycerol kinase
VPAFRVPVHALPEPREPFARYGETDAGGRCPGPCPLRVFGDSQASFFAQRCFQPGTAKATFGTGTSVLFNIGRDCRLSSGGVVTALAWVLQGQRIYALEGLINYSAATLAWLKDQLGLIDDVAQAEPLATAVPDNGGVYLVPAFAGLGAPYWSADARAAIVGLTAFSKREHVVRAALESIAYQVRDVLDLMGVEAGVTLQALHADGGPTRNAFLMQFTADVAGVELRASDVPEASALGAAMAGCLGLGIHPSLERLSALRREVRTFKPQLAPAAVERLRAGWLAAVKRVL